MQSNRLSTSSAGFSNQLLSRSTYNLAIGLCLLWGLGVNTLMVHFFDPTPFKEMNRWVFLIGYFVIAFSGIYLNTTSDKPWLSFLGYNLVLLPVGAVLMIVLSPYSMGIISQAALATTMVTGLMMLGAILFPSLALSLGKFLFWTLLAYILAQVGLLIAGVHLSFMAHLGALLFSLFIAFDWAKSQDLEPTLDNAIDSACALYLDIINLFLKILEIMGRK